MNTSIGNSGAGGESGSVNKPGFFSSLFRQNPPSTAPTLTKAEQDAERENLYFVLVLLLTGGTTAVMASQYADTFKALGGIAEPLADLILKSGGVAGAFAGDTFTIFYSFYQYVRGLIAACPNLSSYFLGIASAPLLYTGFQMTSDVASSVSDTDKADMTLGTGGIFMLRSITAIVYEGIKVLRRDFKPLNWDNLQSLLSNKDEMKTVIKDYSSKAITEATTKGETCPVNLNELNNQLDAALTTSRESPEPSLTIQRKELFKQNADELKDWIAKKRSEAVPSGRPDGPQTQPEYSEYIPFDSKPLVKRARSLSFGGKKTKKSKVKKTKAKKSKKPKRSLKNKH